MIRQVPTPVGVRIRPLVVGDRLADAVVHGDGVDDPLRPATLAEEMGPDVLESPAHRVRLIEGKDEVIDLAPEADQGADLDEPRSAREHAALLEDDRKVDV